MIQSFQCPICANLNAFGEPSCVQCGQNFVYNCPVCGCHISNRYANCPSCRTAFQWSRLPQQDYQPIGLNTTPSPVNKTADETIPVQDIHYESTTQAKVQSTVYPGRQPIRNRSTARMEPGITSRPAFWVMLMIGCIIAIAILLFIDRMINA